MNVSSITNTDASMSLLRYKNINDTYVTKINVPMIVMKYFPVPVNTLLNKLA